MLLVQRLAFLSLAAIVVDVPAGAPVMIDGRYDPAAWRDAAVVEMGGGAEIHIKTSAGFVFIAIALPDSQTGFTDLYLAPGDGSLLDLHASAKLGERRRGRGGWPEFETWWNNDAWVANLSRVDSFEKRTFLPQHVREYQIRRSRFPAREWKLAVDMSINVDGTYHVVRYPAAASDSTTDAWLTVRFASD
jgi:hypothetical protein